MNDTRCVLSKICHFFLHNTFLIEIQIKTHRLVFDVNDAFLNHGGRSLICVYNNLDRNGKWRMGFNVDVMYAVSAGFK